VACVAFAKWCKLSKEQKLKELVAWSVTGDYCPALGRNSYDRELRIAILNAQCDDAIAMKYRITEDTEKQYMMEIIGAYQKEISKDFFLGKLSLIKSKYAVSNEEYFMLMLYTFLSDYYCDYDFLGHDMHKERISYKSYGSTISAGFEATYTLTGFAVVFHKMHYITYMYCRKNDILRNFIPEWNEKNLKEILDTKQIQLSRY